MSLNTIRSWAVSLLIVSSCLSTTPVVADEGGPSKLSVLLGALAKNLAEVSEAAKQRNAALRGEQPQAGMADQQNSTWSPKAYNSAADQKLILNGMWRDPDTGLTWMRCKVSQDKPWGGTSDDVSQCDSSKPTFKSSYAWDENMVLASQLHFGGYSDWRLPTLTERLSLKRCDTEYGLIPVPVIYDTSTDRYKEDGLPRVSCGTKKDPNYPVLMMNKPSAEKMNVYGGELADLSARGRPIAFVGVGDYQNITDIEQSGSRAGYAVRSDQPNVIFTQNLVVAKKVYQDRIDKDASVIAATKAQIAKNKVDDAALGAKIHKESVAMAQRVSRFRAAIHAGDYTTKGLVIQVNGNLVLVQTSYDQQWFNRNSIYPTFCSNTIMCW